MPSGRNIWTNDDWAATDAYPTMIQRQSKETINVMAPLYFYDDFLGDSVDAKWDVTQSNESTVAVVATQPNGVVAFTHTGTSESQQANIDWGDIVSLNPNKDLVAEFRINLAVAPTDVVEMYFGLTSDNDAASESKDIHASFAFDGSSSLLISADDGSTDGTPIDTGLDGADGTWYICKIDMGDLSSVKFYVNGTQMAALDMSNIGATDYLQPYISSYKSTGTGVGTLELDYVKIWSKRA